MKTLWVVLVLMLVACGGRLADAEDPGRGPEGRTERDTQGEGPREDGVVRGPSGGYPVEGGAPDSGGASEVQLTSCGTGAPTWDRPYVTCVEWNGAPGTDPRCATNPLRPVETDPSTFGLHAFQGACPTTFYAGKCERRFTWNGATYRTVEVYVPMVYPWRPSDWYVRRDEFRGTCESSGGAFIEPVPNVAPAYPCNPNAYTCPEDAGL